MSELLSHKREADYIPVYFSSLLKIAPDISIEQVTFLLGLRGDLKRNQIAECIQGCRTVLQKENETINENKKKISPFFSNIPMTTFKFF